MSIFHIPGSQNVRNKLETAPQSSQFIPLTVVRAPAVVHLMIHAPPHVQHTQVGPRAGVVRQLHGAHPAVLLQQGVPGHRPQAVPSVGVRGVRFNGLLESLFGRSAVTQSGLPGNEKLCHEELTSRGYVAILTRSLP